MKRLIFSLLLCIASGAFGQNLAKSANLAPIAELAGMEIRKGNLPGAVVLIGNTKQVLYREAFGFRTLKPAPLAMTPETRFDLASLTKVVATTTAIMQLNERKKLRIDDTVARY